MTTNYQDDDTPDHQETGQPTRMWTKQLWTAIRRSDAVGVQNAIRNGAPVSTDDSHPDPLAWPCRNGDAGIVRILLDAGADARWRNDSGFSGILEACSQGHTSIVEMLINHDKDLLEFADKFGQTPLVVATNHGRVDAVRFLLGRGANIHGALEYGGTLLMLASTRGVLDVMRLLLAAGSDVEAHDENQQTALA